VPACQDTEQHAASWFDAFCKEFITTAGRDLSAGKSTTIGALIRFDESEAHKQALTNSVTPSKYVPVQSVAEEKNIIDTHKVMTFGTNITHSR
jgi:hypothetical protein